MDLRILTEKDKKEYNKTVTHVIQSWEWGDFRKSFGVPIERYGIYKNNKLITAFQISFHKIPLTKQYVGYLPKGPLPDKELAEAIEKIGLEKNCALIKVEPNIESSSKLYTIYPKFLPSPKPYFTKYNFVLDLTKSDEEILKNMHPKTRYNIRVAEKKGVVVKERTDDEAFKEYVKLYFETTRRQGYHGHNTAYHKKAWEILKKDNIARLLIGYYQNKPLTAWMLYIFKDTLYYPYGGSSDEHKEVMSNNLVAWEAIKLGKRMGLRKFDMWGALEPDAPQDHPWQGFNRFKKNYGGELIQYIGTYDLVFNDPLYWAFTFIDKFTNLKVALLKILGR